MGVSFRALELAGTIDEQRRLHVDEPLPIAGPSRVRIILLIPEETDVDETEWLQAAASNPAFDFLKEPEEDIYTLADGKPVSDFSDYLANLEDYESRLSRGEIQW